MLSMKTYTNSSARIIKLLKDKDWSQTDLAKKLDISPQAVQQWVKGLSSPKGKNLAKLSEITKLPQHWFFIEEEPTNTSKTSFSTSNTISSGNIRKLPIISWEQAGNWDLSTPIAEIFSITDWMEVMANVSKDAFIMKMKDDTMRSNQGIPTIPEGSFVVIDPNFKNIEELNGKIVLVQEKHAKEPMLKRLLIDGPNIYLTSLNPKFDDIKYNDINLLIFKGKVKQIVQQIED